MPGQITPEYFLSQLHDVRRERRNKKYPREKRGSTDKLLRTNRGFNEDAGYQNTVWVTQYTNVAKDTGDLMGFYKFNTVSIKRQSEFYPILLECESWFACKSKGPRKRERKEQLIYQKDD